MDFQLALSRFKFLAEALEGSGGFAPRIHYALNPENLSKPSHVVGSCHLVPYPRESQEKYAARAACAVYENHLKRAASRFVNFISRKGPSRDGLDNPLMQVVVNDADDAGNHLDGFWRSFAFHAKARGSMLLLLDLPRGQAQTTVAQAISGGSRRVVPYLVAIEPERVAEYQLDDKGRFTFVAIHATEVIDGKEVDVIRRWDAQGWQVLRGKDVIDQGEHPFGECPVLPFTETGGPFPVVGDYGQVADLSRRIYNARSERDEILRSQTFSLLTLQIPENVADPSRWVTEAAAKIGTHSLLVHQGDTPAFIAPDSGPAQVYASNIAEMEAAIANITLDSATNTNGQSESGVSRKIRFEALNADLASFAMLMQGLERRVWDLVHRAMRLQNRVTVDWPTDYNLTDTAGELDILALMQSTGFPEQVLTEKRRAIVNAEFDRADEDAKARLMSALDEGLQESAA